MSIRIGVICPSEIAFRRFLPSLSKVSQFEFAGVAIASPEEWFGETGNVEQDVVNRQQASEKEKAGKFISSYG